MHQRGYETQLGKCCPFPPDATTWPDADRAKELIDAWFDPEIKGIICSRGGYGCARLLPYLPLDEMANSPKLFVGFSDITTLHLALNRRNLATLHAPMILSLMPDRKDWVIEQWFCAMEGKANISMPKDAKKPECMTKGMATGAVTGGCLCLLCDSLGTKDELNTDDKILLIEDVDEPPHRIDAMLTHLLNSNKLQEAAGIVVGEMTRTNEKRDDGISSPKWEEIVSERLSKLNVPTVVGFPFGHSQDMASLPLGIDAKLDATNGTLEYLELGVEIS